MILVVIHSSFFERHFLSQNNGLSPRRIRLEEKKKKKVFFLSLAPKKASRSNLPALRTTTQKKFASIKEGKKKVETSKQKSSP